MSSSNSPCAACKLQRRKCTQDCIFAPYFPADQPQRFATIHKVFGASNVSKILNELHKDHREDAVNSLAYEAEARLRDPIHGCVALIPILQQTLNHLHLRLDLAKQELASQVGPAAMIQMLQCPYIQHPDFMRDANPQLQHCAIDAQQSFGQLQNDDHAFLQKLNGAGYVDASRVGAPVGAYDPRYQQDQPPLLLLQQSAEAAQPNQFRQPALEQLLQEQPYPRSEAGP